MDEIVHTSLKRGKSKIEAIILTRLNISVKVATAFYYFQRKREKNEKTQSLFLKQKEILGTGVDYTRGRFEAPLISVVFHRNLFENLCLLKDIACEKNVCLNFLK